MEKNRDEDWIDVMDAFMNYDKYEAEFESFMMELEAYATEHNITTRYVEEEFLIDGEFIPVKMVYHHDLSDGEYPERDEEETYPNW